MRRFLEGLSGIDELIAAGEELPPFDVHAAIMSLPHWLDLPHPQESPPPPYLFADPQLVVHWKGALRSCLDSRRNQLARPADAQTGPLSLDSPAQFLPLGEIPGVQLVICKRDLAASNFEIGPAGEKVLDLGSRLDETMGAFMDTAAVLHSLDLVITSDTSLAHLAGAMNRPVWLALCDMPDWRWLLTGERTPWYPSMRLFRQPVPGDWSTVFGQLEAELRKLVAET